MTIELSIFELVYGSSYIINHHKFLDQIYPKLVFSAQNRKSKHYYRIKHIPISVDPQFHLKQIIFIFWTKFAQKGYFRSKTEKVNVTIEINVMVYIRIDPDANFCLKQTILIFLAKFSP